MRRLTISIDDELADTFDRFMQQKGYQNRSEAFRDLLRGELGRDSVDQGGAHHCVAALSYVYNHHQRQLAGRLAQLQHDHHDVTVSTMHAHLDHDNCIETMILRGHTQEVVQFAEALIAEKGVRHGKFNVIPVESETNGREHPQHHHVHLRPHR
ncbi:nickel-responsive regulator [Steroidobacter agaridevorans]|uniref:Putative nickel-responsive regulator n=1 Tax=Steroidobacter agaridevorans TaxID=2695856 RepID=A0A829Y9F5_9GAMM|nr:nickel-responsive transcriptional regulator NikR [Steroidobacter agaridevorans]GFE79633.1 nickel-responsive regulator [Steroidobacter agaridevorans]